MDKEIKRKIELVRTLIRRISGSRIHFSLIKDDSRPNPCVRQHTHRYHELKIDLSEMESAGECHVLLVPPDVVHEYTKGHLILTSIRIGATLHVDWNKEKFLLELPEERTSGSILSDFLRMLEKLAEKDAYDPVQEGLLRTIFQMLEITLEREDAVNMICSSKVPLEERAIYYMEQHYPESDLSVEKIAAEMGCTQQHLNLCFRNAKLGSVRNQLIRIRLKHAKEYIDCGGLRIKDIARNCGWKNQFFFSRSYQKHYGSPPSGETKQSNRKELEMHSDGHIHLWNAGSVPDREFPERLKKAGVSGGLLMSLPPPCFRSEVRLPAKERLEHLFAWHRLIPGFYPFFWLDPTERDAEKQMDRAAKAGVCGFKIICDHFYPYEERPMKMFQRIADMGFPILFHSGCLVNEKPAGIFNMPMNFECLVRVRRLRFSLAHIGWPWCDDYLALALLMRIREKRDPENCRMFIDNTVGTPDIYRKPVFEKLFDVCEVKDRMYFGADQIAENYDDRQVAWYMNRDDNLYRELGLTAAEICDINTRNLKRFVNGD